MDIIKRYLFIIVLVITIFFFGKNLLPGNTMFDFHDETQAARIYEFAYDLKHIQIPPRIAPHMSYSLGYPIFNYYAPSAYWISSAIHLIGFDIPDSIKLSFLLSLIVGFTGMYFFLKNYFNIYSAIIGAFFYITSPYIAVEIFVRGNLAEIWYIALLPWVLHFIQKNVTSESSITFITTTVLTVFLLTVHNIFSLISIPLLLIYIVLMGKYKKSLISFGLALLLSSYFLVPAVAESSLTYASEAAKKINYQEHFLCSWQIWTTLIWGYGGSTSGCEADGMSFMVGKIQIILGVLGILLFILNRFIRKDAENQLIIFSFLLLLSGFTFLTTYSSSFIWGVFSPIFSLFQFPWRFLIFTLFGLSFFSAYLFSKSPIKLIQLLIPLCIIYICYDNAEYFSKPFITKQEFSNRYLTEKYIREEVVYRVSEYLPKTAQFDEWFALEKDEKKKNRVIEETKHLITPLDSKGQSSILSNSLARTGETNSNKFILNVHYLPNWKITINNSPYIPSSFDYLGRPIVETTQGNVKKISVRYSQTMIEVISNILTAVSIVILILIGVNKTLWRRLTNISS